MCKIIIFTFVFILLLLVHASWKIQRLIQKKESFKKCLVFDSRNPIMSGVLPNSYEISKNVIQWNNFGYSYDSFMHSDSIRLIKSKQNIKIKNPNRKKNVPLPLLKSKADDDMYRRLIENGDEEKALAIAKRKYEQCIKNGYTIPSHMCPCTTVHELVGEIKEKAEKRGCE